MPLPFINESRDLLDVLLLILDDGRALQLRVDQWASEPPIIRFIKDAVEIFLLFPLSFEMAVRIFLLLALSLLILWVNLSLNLPKSADESVGEFLCSVDGSGGELLLLLLIASSLLQLIDGSPELPNRVLPTGRFSLVKSSRGGFLALSSSLKCLESLFLLPSTRILSESPSPVGKSSSLRSPSQP